MLTYTVKDKWSLPFDIFCFDLNCSEYYNNKYPILIEPAATYSLIPYEYMELIKNKYFNEEFKTGKCYYKYDYDYLGKIFRIKCEDLKKIKMVMLYNNKGIQLSMIYINCDRGFYSIENYSSWLLNYDALFPNFYLDYESKTITLYDQLVEFPNLHFRNIKKIIKTLIFLILVFLLIGFIFIIQIK